MTVKEFFLGPGRWKWALPFLALVAVGVGAYWWVAAKRESDQHSVSLAVAEPSAQSAASTEDLGGTVAAADSGQVAHGSPEESAGEVDEASPERAAEDTDARGASETTASSRRAPAAPSSWMVADEQLTLLSDLALSDEMLTVEQVEELRIALQRLTALGDGAVPAIQDFLRRGTDLDMNAAFDAELRREVGHPEYDSLRLALLDVLAGIGGPEAEEVMHDELRRTRTPAEIAAMADYLDEMAPGYYRDEALVAAREVLKLARDGQLGGDVGGLFRVLETYGDAEAVAELEDNIDERWGQYSIVALGGVADGAGVPVLMDMVENAAFSDSKTSPYSDRDLLALQTLTQAAPIDFGASGTLVDKAREGAIPADFWPTLASVLAGDDQLQIRRPDIDRTAVTPFSTSSAKRYPYNAHRIGPYTLYSVHRSAQLTDDEVMARLELVSQLLEATDDPAAKDVLERSKKMLTEGAQ